MTKYSSCLGTRSTERLWIILARSFMVAASQPGDPDMEEFCRNTRGHHHHYHHHHLQEDQGDVAGVAELDEVAALLSVPRRDGAGVGQEPWET